MKWRNEYTVEYYIETAWIFFTDYKIKKINAREFTLYTSIKGSLRRGEIKKKKKRRRKSHSVDRKLDFQRGEGINREEAQWSLLGIGNVLYLDLGGSYTGIYIRQNSLNVHLRFVHALNVCYTSKRFFKGLKKTSKNLKREIAQVCHIKQSYSVITGENIRSYTKSTQNKNFVLLLRRNILQGYVV